MMMPRTVGRVSKPDRQAPTYGQGCLYLEALSPERARAIGEAGRKRILSEHTYSHRSRQLETILQDMRN